MNFRKYAKAILHAVSPFLQPSCADKHSTPSDNRVSSAPRIADKAQPAIVFTYDINGKLENIEGLPTGYFYPHDKAQLDLVFAYDIHGHLENIEGLPTVYVYPHDVGDLLKLKRIPLCEFAP